jgi:hypothetical protein
MGMVVCIAAGINDRTTGIDITTCGNISTRVHIAAGINISTRIDTPAYY